jgi:hypothetical protein
MSLSIESQTRPSVGIAINAYGDPILLDPILEFLVSSQIADKICVLDGPYLFCREVFKQFGFYVDESESPIKHICDSYSTKVNYFFEIFADEAEKRISLYSKLDTDIIILLDTDELPFAFDSANLISFWESSAEVATLQMYNIFDETTMIGESPRKKAVFKRNAVSAIDHLDYTWLIGVSQKPTSLQNVSTLAIADICHFTMQRSNVAMQQKFIFYTTLWHRSNRQVVFSDAASYLLELGFSSSALTMSDRETLLSSVIRTDPAYAGFASSQPTFPLPSSMCGMVKQHIDKFGLSSSKPSRIILRNDNKPVYFTVDDSGHSKTYNSLLVKLSDAQTINLSKLSILRAVKLDGSIIESKSTLRVLGDGLSDGSQLMMASLPPQDSDELSLPIRLSIRYNGKNECCATASILPSNTISN